MLPSEYGTRAPLLFPYHMLRDMCCGASKQAGRPKASATGGKGHRGLGQSLLGEQGQASADLEGGVDYGVDTVTDAKRAASDAAAEYNTEAVGMELAQQEADGRTCSLKSLGKTFALEHGVQKLAVSRLSASFYEGPCSPCPCPFALS